MSVELPICAWYGDLRLTIAFPRDWEATVHKMAGHDAPILTRDQIRRKLTQPIGSEPLHQLAKGKKECVILVDDLTRPTKARQIIPQILDELHDGGMKDDRIRFVIAPGAHHWMRLDDVRKKLGDDVPDQYNIYNHNVYENNVFLGKTSNGTPVCINREVMKCDLKIGLGCIIPHEGFGYGGGGKIVVPGIASIDTIRHNHEITNGVRGVGGVERNIRRLDAEEAAAMAGLDFIVNVLVNPNRDCCDLVCGDPVAAHRTGVKLARSHYLTESTNADIVVVNSYPTESEAYKALHMVGRSLRDEGDVVVLVHTPEGLRGHYYNGRFGTDYGGGGWKPAKYLSGVGRTRKAYVVAPYSSLADHQYLGLDSRWFKSWDEALDHLKTKHRESGVRVALYPYAPIQILKDIC